MWPFLEKGEERREEKRREERREEKRGERREEWVLHPPARKTYKSEIAAPDRYTIRYG